MIEEKIRITIVKGIWLQSQSHSEALALGILTRLFPRLFLRVFLVLLCCTSNAVTLFCVSLISGPLWSLSSRLPSDSPFFLGHLDYL